MAIDTAGTARANFELKSALLPVVAIALKTSDTKILAIDLALRLAKEPDFFDKDPVLIDLSALRDNPRPIDFFAITALLRQCRTMPVAVRGGNPAQMRSAYNAGLIAAPEAAPAARSPARPPEQVVQIQEVVREVQVEVVREVQVEVVREVEIVREVFIPGSGTVIVDKPLRTGQQVYARGADLVIMAMVSFGAEIIADGNIHVYAPLRGRAIAGARGDISARIFSTCMEPQLLSIAGIYRTYEAAMSPDVQGKPAHVRLDGEKLLVEPL